MLKELENAENKVVGLKQLLRGLAAGEVRTVYIAEDADAWIKEQITAKIGDQDVRVVRAESMRELGTACGIDVSAACAAILKN